MRRLIRLYALVSAVVACTAGVAMADSLYIFSARYDAAVNQVVLVGGGFRSDVRILLTGHALPTVKITADELRAALPPVVSGN